MSESPVRLALASASPRRVELLAQLGIRCDQVPADVDETQHPDESSAEMVERLAVCKVVRAAEILGQTTPDLGGLYVAGGDTTVLCGGEILGKPDDDNDARRMLRLLSGRRHEVVSGIAVCSAVDCAIESAIEVTSVWFRPLTARDLSWYLSSGEHRGKAGSYGIQGAASVFVERVEGDYSSIVGLPLAGLDRLLNRFGRSLIEFGGA
ncbi:MAG: Maf family protein [Acidimicrobiales bacterium]